MAPRAVVIGYGNTLRGDDGVGPRVAATAGARAGVGSRCVHQLTPELASMLANVDVAVFVDARAADAGGVVEVSALEPGGDGPALGHGSDPRGLLALTQAVYGVCPRAWLVTVPAVSFELGEELSASAQAAAMRAVDIVTDLARRAYMDLHSVRECDLASPEVP